MNARSINAIVWLCILVAVNAAVIVEGVRGGVSVWSVMAGIALFSTLTATIGACIDEMINKIARSKNK